MGQYKIASKGRTAAVLALAGAAGAGLGYGGRNESKRWRVIQKGQRGERVLYRRPAKRDRDGEGKYAFDMMAVGFLEDSAHDMDKVAESFEAELEKLASWLRAGGAMIRGIGRSVVDTSKAYASTGRGIGRGIVGAGRGIVGAGAAAGRGAVNAATGAGRWAGGAARSGASSVRGAAREGSQQFRSGLGGRTLGQQKAVDRIRQTTTARPSPRAAPTRAPSVAPPPTTAPRPIASVGQQRASSQAMAGRGPLGKGVPAPQTPPGIAGTPPGGTVHTKGPGVVTQPKPKEQWVTPGGDKTAPVGGTGKKPKGKKKKGKKGDWFGGAMKNMSEREKMMLLGGGAATAGAVGGAVLAN